jgi:hypothetical protein
VSKTFTVTEKLHLGFTPKDGEEGSIPLPDSLIDLLKLRRPTTCYIFEREDSGTDDHLLRIVKRSPYEPG